MNPRLCVNALIVCGISACLQGCATASGGRAVVNAAQYSAENPRPSPARSCDASPPTGREFLRRLRARLLQPLAERLCNEPYGLIA